MKRRLTQTTCRRGFTLTELGIVLMVTALCMSAIWTIARNMNENAKQAAFAELLLSISGSARGYYAGLAGAPTTDTEASMADLAQKGVFPIHVLSQVGTTWVVDTAFGRLTNPHSAGSDHKSLYVCGWQTDGKSANKHCDFTGTFSTNVPLFAVEALMTDEYCINAIMRNSATSNLPGLMAIYVNGNAQTVPIGLSTAIQACNDPDVNYVDWVFRPS